MPTTKQYRKIGVWQTAFLGDAVLTLPLIRTLSRAFPGAEVHFFVRQGFGELFVAQPELTTVREFAKRGRDKSLAAAWRLGRSIGAEGFDLWVSAHGSTRSGLVALASAIGERIGYSRPLLNRLFYTTLVDRRFDELEEIERLLELARPLGIEEFETWPALAIAPRASAAAEEFWREHVGTARVVGVHPGSVWPTKRWPEEYFSALVRQATRSGATVLLFGAPGEEQRLAGRVLAGAGPLPAGGVHDLSGRLRLPELAAFLGRLDVYVSNDSGPLHIAWAQRTPTVAIFGPTVRRLGFYPRGEAATVMEVEGLACRPCGLHGGRRCRPGHHQCMRSIRPEAVWEVAAAKLGTRP